MKIAATYENGNIFQHFGRTEQFKIYEIEDGKVVSGQVIGNDGLGHGALAGLLADRRTERSGRSRCGSRGGSLRQR